MYNIERQKRHASSFCLLYLGEWNLHEACSIPPSSNGIHTCDAILSLFVMFTSADVCVRVCARVSGRRDLLRKKKQMRNEIAETFDAPHLMSSFS